MPDAGRSMARSILKFPQLENLAIHGSRKWRLLVARSNLWPDAAASHDVENMLGVSVMKFTAYEFANAVEARIEALSLEQYHKRPRSAKRLIEELYPMSRLALALKQPGLTVEVEALENSGRADGHIWIAGFLEKTFEVQVTFAGYERSDALRSNLLVDQGFAPGAGPIKRDKKTGRIEATMEAEDIDAPVKRLGESICKRSRAKALKPYVPGTVLLVAFEDMRLRGRGWWSLLYAAIDSAGGIERGPFAQVYLLNGCSNELQQAA